MWNNLIVILGGENDLFKWGRNNYRLLLYYWWILRRNNWGKLDNSNLFIFLRF